jgi:hypothetical protein
VVLELLDKVSQAVTQVHLVATTALRVEVVAQVALAPMAQA